MLTLGVLAIGGVAVASSFAGGDGGGNGVLQPKKGRAGQILGGGQQPGAVYNFPAQGAVSFPAPPTYDMSRFLPSLPTAPVPAIGRGAAGISAAPKKYRETGEVGLGYEGYVTPKIPTPIAPPYIPGVTTFVPYKESAYVPSPVKIVGEHMYSPTSGSSYGDTTPKKTPTDASKAIAHAKRLRAGRGD